MSARGEIRGAISVPGPCVVRISWYDADGRLLGRRRSRDLTYSLTLPPGIYRIDVEDDRPLSNERRHGSTRTMVEVVRGEAVEVPLHLTSGTTISGLVEIDGECARYARVSLRHEDGEMVELRADGHGGFVATGLRPGAVTLSARDARRDWSGRPAEVGADRTEAVTLRLDTPTGGLVVLLTHPDGAAALATRATFIHLDSGRSYPARVAEGLCAITGVAPGAYDLVVEPARGSLGGRFAVGSVGDEQLGSACVVLGRSAIITGRVVDGRLGLGELAAVVTLVDATGTEIDRTRTDSYGRFCVGRGLSSADELTLIVSAGPERLHVIRTALADIKVTEGEPLNVGDISVVPTCRAVWSPRLQVSATMKLPVTRV